MRVMSSTSWRTSGTPLGLRSPMATRKIAASKEVRGVCISPGDLESSPNQHLQDFLRLEASEFFQDLAR